MSAAVIADNTTIKIDNLQINNAYTSGNGGTDITVLTTGAGEYAKVSLVHTSGPAGNGATVKLIDPISGVEIFQWGAQGSGANIDTSYSKESDMIFVPPNHNLVFRNAVISGTQNLRIRGTRWKNTP